MMAHKDDVPHTRMDWVNMAIMINMLCMSLTLLLFTISVNSTATSNPSPSSGCDVVPRREKDFQLLLIFSSIFHFVASLSAIALKLHVISQGFQDNAQPQVAFESEGLACIVSWLGAFGGFVLLVLAMWYKVIVVLGSIHCQDPSSKAILAVGSIVIFCSLLGAVAAGIYGYEKNKQQ